MEAKRPFSDADWDNTPAPVKEYVTNLEHQVSDLTSKVDLLFKKVEELENRINKNSGNSNKPPSSDPPFKKPKKKGQKSKLKRGAVNGHLIVYLTFRTPEFSSLIIFWELFFRFATSS